MFSSAETQLIYQVANAPIRVFPYPHILVHDALPEEFYRGLRLHLPPDTAYKSPATVGMAGENYPESRSILPLTRAEISLLPEPYHSFWDEMAQWLLGGPFAHIFLQKFGPLLEQRFENPQRLELRNEAMIVQDRTNFRLGPHTDARTKVLSLLLYLPADDTMPQLGTSMYVPRDPTFTCPGGRYHNFADFTRLATVPYVANTLFAFMKTPNSFHGVEPVWEENVERALLLFDIRAAQ